MKMLTVLDLFSGIGAFSLGLERAGMKTISFCEIDPFCRRVLAKHWPEVRCYQDVRELSAQHLTADGHSNIDLICGGFPCQDISVAGRGAGLAGERSGLWSEFARLIGEIRPRYAIVENVAALLGRGIGDVLGDLAALGYDAEWHCIPASAVGAPHIRDRVWIVAYARCRGVRPVSEHREERSPARAIEGEGDQRERLRHAVGGCGEDAELADANSRGRREQGHVSEASRDARAGQSCDGSPDVPDTDGARCERERSTQSARRINKPVTPRTSEDVANTHPAAASRARHDARVGRLAIPLNTFRSSEGRDFWATEPDVGRVVDGPAARVDRRKRLIGLGNSLVPQIPELIGRAIMAAERATIE